MLQFGGRRGEDWAGACLGQELGGRGHKTTVDSFYAGVKFGSSHCPRHSSSSVPHETPPHRPVSNLSECQRTRNASLCSLLEVKLTQRKLTHSHWFIWWQLVQSQHWAMAAFINPSHCHQLEGGASRTRCFPFL